MSVATSMLQPELSLNQAFPSKIKSKKYRGKSVYYNQLVGSVEGQAHFEELGPNQKVYQKEAPISLH